jgi:glucose-1-phosphate cytidylyltransferase
VGAADLRVNGGYYILRRAILDHLGSGDDLVGEPFAQLATKQQLAAYRHDGFWVALDTLKELDLLQALEAQDAAPWAVWRGSPATVEGARATR